MFIMLLRDELFIRLHTNLKMILLYVLRSTFETKQPQKDQTKQTKRYVFFGFNRWDNFPRYSNLFEIIKRFDYVFL